MLRVGEGDLVGKPLKLEPFQVDFIRRCFPASRKVRRAILSIARKNGKTALIAVLVLAALMGPLAVPYGEVISAARSREQAGQVFRYASKMLLVSGLMSRVIVRDTRKEIVDKITRVTYRATSADAKTNHGSAPFLVIHDELGQVEGSTDQLYDSLSTSMGAYESGALEIVISTQAASDADLLSLLIDDALRGGDDTTVCVLYSAPLDADPFVESTWKLANPALGIFRSISDVRAQATRAQRIPAAENAFRNLILNQRVSTESHWLAEGVWRMNQRPPDPDLFTSGRLVFGGLDLSLRTDLSALVLVAEDDDGDVHVLPTFWTPADTLRERALRDRAPFELWVKQGHLTACPGGYVSYRDIGKKLVEVGQTMSLGTINYDRYRMRELVRELEHLEADGIELPFAPSEDGEGFREFTNCGQGWKSMTPALEAVEQLAIEGKLRCGGNPVLTWNVASARVKADHAMNRVLDKRHENRRIDGAVALAMACKALKVDNAETGLSATGTVIFAG